VAEEDRQRRQEEFMTDSENETGGTQNETGGTPGGALSSAARRAQHAIDAAKGFVQGSDLDQLRTKAGDAATALYKSGRDLISSTPEFDKATDELRESIRRNPLAAVGIAFTAGLLVALLTRG
jgi:ElaB/YqjD/DUF883 family membrane-anchored ribosome-binding protein